MSMNDIRSVSDLLLDLRASLTGPRVSVDHIVLHMHERGFGALLFIFAVPMALPVPVPPGINVMLATPLILLAAQQAMGRHTVWIPKSVRQKTVSSTLLAQFIDRSLPCLSRLEVLIKPRLGGVTRGIFSHMIGVMGMIMALSVCVPLPLTNTVPSLGIALMAAGVIMRDGLAVVAGAVIGMLWVFMLVYALAVFGPEGIDMIKEAIKNAL